MPASSIADLVAALPRGDEFAAKATGRPRGFGAVSAPSLAFVPPDLVAEQPLQPGRTAVLLISAPGAVGKSSLAEELAARTGAPLWDLSRVNVGSGTLAGTVHEAYADKAVGNRSGAANRSAG